MKTESFWVASILVLATLLRLWGIDFDLPYVFHPDEPVYIAISQNMFKTGDLNPHFFNYPSLFFYVNALAYGPYFLIGKLLGIFQSPSDIPGLSSLAMGVTRAPMPTAILLGRLVTLVFGIGTVGLVYLCGKQLTGRAAVGALAALMAATSPTTVGHSRHIAPDTFVVLFALASFLASILIYQQGKVRHYLTAGLFVGFTASSKYNGGLIVLPLIAAHFLRYGISGLKRPSLYLSLSFCVLGFFATTPYALFDSANFWADLRFEAQHYATGHAGMEGESFKYYLTYMWETGGALYLLALCGIVYGFTTRPKETVLLSIFPLTYLAFISGFVVRNDRTFLPVAPFLYLSAAWFLLVLFDRIRLHENAPRQKTYYALFAAIVLFAFVQPVSRTVSDTRYLTTVNSRKTAAPWLNANLPEGAKVAVESYSTFVDPSRFSVQGFGRLIDNRPEWYLEQEFNYLLFGQGMYGRFYQDSARYQDEISRYNRLFERFGLVKTFTDGGYEVLVYRVR